MNKILYYLFLMGMAIGTMVLGIWGLICIDHLADSIERFITEHRREKS
jgi:hypothetical protein